MLSGLGRTMMVWKMRGLLSPPPTFLSRTPHPLLDMRWGSIGTWRLPLSPCPPLGDSLADRQHLAIVTGSLHLLSFAEDGLGVGIPARTSTTLAW